MFYLIIRKDFSHKIKTKTTANMHMHVRVTRSGVNISKTKYFHRSCTSKRYHVHEF